VPDQPPLSRYVPDREPSEWADMVTVGRYWVKRDPLLINSVFTASEEHFCTLYPERGRLFGFSGAGPWQNPITQFTLPSVSELLVDPHRRGSGKLEAEELGHVQGQDMLNGTRMQPKSPVWGCSPGAEPAAFPRAPRTHAMIVIPGWHRTTGQC
jgi:hypothetical protein